jgi:SNF2 family DNA or RNA helicase
MKGERLVLFSRLKRMQTIIQDALRERFGIHAPIINGEVAGIRRVELVEEFNKREGFGALILGPEAGGVGLNITGANHVIHYTRLWNPAKENQATDRVHRLGQTRPVTVHYPIVRDSVEEKLDRLLEDKRSLAENVLIPRESLSVMNELVESLVVTNG